MNCVTSRIAGFFLAAALLASAMVEAALPARISLRQAGDGSIEAALTGLMPACGYGFVQPPALRVEPPRILVMSGLVPMACPATILPLPSRPFRVTAALPPLADGSYFVSWVDGYAGSPVGDVLDSLRYFSVRGGRVVTPVRDLTRNFYVGFLGREPDAGGADYWAGVAETFVERGFDDRDIALLLARTFIASGELHASGLADSEYLRRLYIGFLGREADGGGLAYWSGLLQAGMPRDWVASVFMHSAEFSSLVARGGDNSTPTRPDDQLIGDVYRAAVGRPPADEEWAYWYAAMHSVPCQIVGKPALVRALAEGLVDRYFVMLGPLTHDEYVVALYDALLRRAADAGGLDFWSGVLESATATRDQVRAAFLQSGDFQARIDAMVRAGCVAVP